MKLLIIKLLLWLTQNEKERNVPNNANIERSLHRLYSDMALQQYLDLRESALKDKMSTGIALTNKDGYAIMVGQRKEIVMMRKNIEKAHRIHQRKQQEYEARSQLNK